MPQYPQLELVLWPLLLHLNLLPLCMFWSRQSCGYVFNDELVDSGSFLIFCAWSAILAWSNASPMKPIVESRSLLVHAHSGLSAGSSDFYLNLLRNSIRCGCTRRFHTMGTCRSSFTHRTKSPETILDVTTVGSLRSLASQSRSPPYW